MKLGFACKYFDSEAKQPFPFKTTTRTRFLAMERNAAATLLLTLAKITCRTSLTLEQLAQHRMHYA